MGKRLLTLGVLISPDTLVTRRSLDRPLYKANPLIVILQHLAEGGP